MHLSINYIKTVKVPKKAISLILKRKMEVGRMLKQRQENVRDE